MRIFKHFPADAICIICGDGHDAECTLIPIDGTQKDNICEATPVHVDCVRDITLRYNRDASVVYSPIPKRDDLR